MSERPPGGDRSFSVLALLATLVAAVPAVARLVTLHDLAVGPGGVLEVGQDDVEAGPAGDVVRLAVADVEPVVAGTAVERVGGLIRATGDVPAGHRPQVVIAFAAILRVDALLGEDPIRPVVAVEGVVITAAQHEVRP